MKHIKTAVVSIALALIWVGCGSNDTSNIDTSNMSTLGDATFETMTTMNEFQEMEQVMVEPVEAEMAETITEPDNSYEEEEYTGWLPTPETEFVTMSSSLDFADAFSTARLMLGNDGYFAWNGTLYTTGWVTESDLWVAENSLDAGEPEVETDAESDEVAPSESNDEEDNTLIDTESEGVVITSDN